MTRDLRDWIALLEREDELVRVSAEVDPHLEITEIVDRVVKSGGPALLFENPRSQHPLLINQFGTERRMCLAFDAESLDDVGRRLGDVLEMQPPQGLAEKVRGLKKLKSIADSMPKTVRSGAAQELVQLATVAEVENRLLRAAPGAHGVMERLLATLPAPDNVVLDLPVSIYAGG